MTASRITARAVVAAVSLLVIGAALGVTIDRHRVTPAMRVTAIRIHEDPFAVMDSALVLRPDQRESVRSIIEARQTDIEGVWGETHRRLLGLLDSTMSDLEAVLDADQVGRLRDLATVIHGSPPPIAH